jgi:hypothetical protein
MTKLIVLATLTAAAICGVRTAGAEAPDQTTQWLYDSCESDDPAKIAACTSYLLGVADTMDIDEAEFRDVSLSASARTQLSVFAICGASYSGESLRQIFLGWAGKHPEQLSTHRWSGAATAIRQAWPCN